MISLVDIGGRPAIDFEGTVIPVDSIKKIDYGHTPGRWVDIHFINNTKISYEDTKAYNVLKFFKINQ